MSWRSGAAWLLMSSVVGACAAAPASPADTPTAAYLAYRKAFEQATDLKEVLPYVNQGVREDIASMSADDLAYGLRIRKDMNNVKDIKVTKETVTGDTAVLEATAMFADGQPAKATLKLAREGGAWKMGRESWNKVTTERRPRDKSCAELIADMKGPSKSDSQAAAAEIYSRDCPESVAALVGILSHEEVWNRVWAAQALGMMRSKAKAGLPGMEAALKTEKEPAVREYLTASIAKIRG